MPAGSIGGRLGAVKDSVDGVSDEFFERLPLDVLGCLAVSGSFEGFGV